MDADIGDVLGLVRERQRRLPAPTRTLPPKHQPQMLLIGCIDARVDPNADLGMRRGDALIYRNPAALVRPYEDKGEEGGNRTMAGTLEFAVDTMGVKHIVVMGHTHCGAINACQCGVDHSTHPNLYKYLKPLLDLVGLDKFKYATDEEHLRVLEQQGVRESVKNLMSYPPVAKAVQAGKLKIHGWVIDIATHRIAELDHGNGQFVPMAPLGKGQGKG